MKLHGQEGKQQRLEGSCSVGKEKQQRPKMQLQARKREAANTYHAATAGSGRKKWRPRMQLQGKGKQQRPIKQLKGQKGKQQISRMQLQGLKGKQ
jgi:hypothetical protein